MTDFIASPLITVVLNIIATGLVAHGIISEAEKDIVVQTTNNAIAGIATVLVSIYSIHKIVDLNKHKITNENMNNIATTTTTVTIPGKIAEPTEPIDQSGK